MFERDKVAHATDEARKREKELLRDIQTVKSRALDKVEQEFKGTAEKLQELHEKKVELMRRPKCKEEMLEYSLRSLQACRKSFIERFLKGLLENYRLLQDNPFNDKEFRRLFEVDYSWRLAPFAISEQDVKDAIAMLPDNGISEKDRQAQIEEIDREIKEISQKVKQRAEAGQ